MAIHPHTASTANQWGRGEFRVLVRSHASDRPVAYCDGEPADERELLRMAEDEGLERAEIQRTVLKTGREIWLVTGVAEAEPED